MRFFKNAAFIIFFSALLIVFGLALRLRIKQDNSLVNVARAASIAHVQTKGAGLPGGNSTLTVNVSSTIAGNLLLVGIMSQGGALTSLTDNASDTFILATSTATGGESFSIYYAKNIVGGATSVTVNVPFGALDMTVAEWSGLDTSTPLDVTVQNDNGFNTGTSYTSGNTPTTNQADELLWGFSIEKYANGTGDTWSPSAGWTNRLKNDFTFLQDKIVSATGIYASDGTVSGQGASSDIFSYLVTFKAAAVPTVLTCTVTTSCPTGVVVFDMAQTANSHAEIPGGGSSYPQLVCCTGVTGLGNSCSGTFARVLKLQKTTNSHVEEGTQSNYANSVCLSVGAGANISVGYQSNNCSGYDTTIGSISGVTNAHVGNASAFTLKICGSGSAVNALSQDHYRWYSNADSVAPGAALAALDTAATAVSSGSTIRLRMNLGATGGILSAGTQAFKLQFATSTAGPWTDVGASGSAAIWRGFDNATPSDGATLGSPLLTSSTVAESYTENNPSIVNPNAIAVSGWGEWDWTVQQNGASSSASYYFRMIKSAGTALATYNGYPSVTTQSTYAPSGSVTSDIIDTASTNGVAPNAIFFEGNMPINTAVQFQFAGSNSSAGPWTYTAWNPNTLSCDASSFYTPASPAVQVEIKASCYNNKRYIRYKMYLSTSDPGSTPRVDRVILNYAP